ncbi:MAG: sulfatase-like hydrolase/transferase [Halioglobus sp.]|nr:sulfatase-like hydrolase/transferase [Halioglobus sp.]
MPDQVYRRFPWKVGALGAVMLLALCIAGCSAPEAWPERGPPNILVIVADDQRWDQLGLVQREQGSAARFPFLRTPHLDALAEQGMRFRNAFVTTSLCSPSRSSILTGQYVHRHLVIDNQTDFPGGPTFATALGEAGYTTAYFGKWHHGSQRARPGFDYVASFMAQGTYYDAPFVVTNPWFDMLGFGPRWTQTEGHVDERTLDYLLDYLDAPRAQPFAVVVGLKGAHQPFTAMEQHRGRFASNEIQAPANWSHFPPWVPRRTLSPEPPSGNRTITAMLETVLSVDESVGRILRAMDERDLADNTLVVFTSDNGYYLGEHLLGDKRSAYEPSMRVPLLLRYPGVIPRGAISDALVLNIDIAPTLVDVALGSVPATMQGRSLKSLYEPPGATWREDFLYEFWQLPYAEARLPGDEASSWGVLASLTTPTIVAVRTRSHKLITYRDKPEYTELYDLVADPAETNNLAGSAGHAELQAQMCARLQRLLDETEYDFEAPVRDWWARSRFADKENSIYAPLAARPVSVTSPTVNCQAAVPRS